MFNLSRSSQRLETAANGSFGIHLRQRAQQPRSPGTPESIRAALEEFYDTPSTKGSVSNNGSPVVGSPSAAAVATATPPPGTPTAAGGTRERGAVLSPSGGSVVVANPMTVSTMATERVT